MVSSLLATRAPGVGPYGIIEILNCIDSSADWRVKAFNDSLDTAWIYSKFFTGVVEADVLSKKCGRFLDLLFPIYASNNSKEREYFTSINYKSTLNQSKRIIELYKLLVMKLSEEDVISPYRLPSKPLLLPQAPIEDAGLPSLMQEVVIEPKSEVVDLISFDDFEEIIVPPSSDKLIIIENPLNIDEVVEILNDVDSSGPWKVVGMEDENPMNAQIVSRPFRNIDEAFALSIKCTKKFEIEFGICQSSSNPKTRGWFRVMIDYKQTLEKADHLASLFSLPRSQQSLEEVFLLSSEGQEITSKTKLDINGAIEILNEMYPSDQWEIKDRDKMLIVSKPFDNKEDMVSFYRKIVKNLKLPLEELQSELTGKFRVGFDYLDDSIQLWLLMLSVKSKSQKNWNEPSQSEKKNEPSQPEIKDEASQPARKNRPSQPETNSSCCIIL